MELILDLLRVVFLLIVNPAVNLPVMLDQAILLGKIILTFIGRNLIEIVIGFTIYFKHIKSIQPVLKVLKPLCHSLNARWIIEKIFFVR